MNTILLQDAAPAGDAPAGEAEGSSEENNEGGEQTAA